MADYTVIALIWEIDMVLSNIPAGFCDNCGNVIFIGKKFCGSCGYRINANTRVIPLGNTTTISDLNSVISPSSPTNVVTPPFDSMKKPTDEQIRAARISPTNPYASWGTLICDDSTQRMWEEAPIRASARGMSATGSYAGNTFCLIPSETGLCVSKCSSQLTDFAFQVHVSPNGNGLVGLIFRSDDIGYNNYRYSFYVGGYSIYLECYLLGQALAHLVSALSVPRNTSKQLPSGFLLAVVAQGDVIDLYVNLSHIIRVYDFNISTGSVGIFASSVHSAIFTHAKVWAKN